MLRLEIGIRESEPLIAGPVEIIPLAEAQLCLDCNCITRSPNGHCLACGSTAVFKLINVLDRKADGEKQNGKSEKAKS